MSESVIADFVAKFNSESTDRGGAVTGRVLLSQKRLVLAPNDGEQATIPLSAVFDVAVGHVPPDMDDFFDATVTVAFERSGERYVAAVEAGEDKIEKFSTVLFKALLNGTEVLIEHPSRVGGRVTDAGFVPARLTVESGTVQFRTAERTVRIRLATVASFDRGRHEVRDGPRPTLKVRHVRDGESVLTLAAMESPRKLSILGRYLRLEYSDLVAELADIELSTAETELLVAIHSGAGQEGMGLANVLDVDPARVTMLLNDLAERDLLVDAERGARLTPKGQVVVSNHLESVNG